MSAPTGLHTLRSRFSADDLVEIGIDEAGRGSFWGPIVAGAVLLPSEDSWTEEQRILFGQLRDSKKLSPKKRAILALGIKQHTICATGIVSAEDINREGISWANREAFRRAALLVMDKAATDSHGVRLLVDGVLSLDQWMGEQHLIVEGDDKYIAIAAASILAKVTHDEWIHAYCEVNKECAERYDLERSNGYGTARHRAGIQHYGGHELHRVIYIQKWLPTSNGTANRVKERGNCLIRF